MTIADELLLGPRGRRLCLGAAMQADGALWTAVFWLARELDPDPGTLMRFAEGDGAADDPSFTETDVAAIVARLDPALITDVAAREGLRASVDSAMYWQEPDGVDAVAALPAVRSALAAIAARLTTLLPQLAAPFAPEATQWTVAWHPMSEQAAFDQSPTTLLSEWTRATREHEARSARELPNDPHANVSGTWWSAPGRLLTTRAHAADALELVEDSLGWEIATAIPVRGAGRILEIRSADDWAALCRGYPTEVTASRRHDWFRVTGRDGRWLIPDWERVAGRWDAVHLTTLGYLSAATTRIDIDAEYASVIAGWAPDSTLWLTDVAHEWSEPRQQWRRLSGGNEWVRDETGGTPS